MLSLVSLVAVGVLFFLEMPRGEIAQIDHDKGRPWGRIVKQPTYLVSLFGAATGYGIMILAMTATPLAMLHHHYGLGAAAAR